jgi:Coenzyme PQQ synthesis protein D (PqqD)
MPQPFSTPDEEAVATAPSTLPDLPSQSNEWNKLMRFVPVPHPKIEGVALEGERVLFDLRTGRSYRLNAVGTAIWEQCTGTATLYEIHRAVCAQLNVSIERMHDDVVSCIAQWGHDGLLAQASSDKQAA